MGDKNNTAISLIKHNVETLKMENKLKVEHADAFDLLDEIYQKKDLISIIDIDPFGSPIEYLEKSIRQLRKNNGYLLVNGY